MMKLPRDMDATALIKGLSLLGYVVTRQTGSHIRMTTRQPQEFHITIPNHSPIKAGTLNSILAEVASQQHMSRKELIQQLL